MRQLFLYLFILFAFSVSAEPLKITGRVIDVDWFNDPVIGASVEVCGAHRGTATDGDGNFSIEVEKGAILKFYSLGFYDKYVEVLNDSSLVIEMNEWNELCFCPYRHVILPDNHLKSPLQIIQILYPDLKQCNDESKLMTYESESGDVIFSIYNGIVCKQYSTLDDENIDLEELFNRIVEAKSFQGGYDSRDKSQSGKVTTYYYPEYSMQIQYVPRKHVSITYELYPEYYK